MMTKAIGFMQLPNENINNMKAQRAETNQIIVWRVTQGLELEANNLVHESKAFVVWTYITVKSWGGKTQPNHSRDSNGFQNDNWHAQRKKLADKNLFLRTQSCLQASL